MTHTHICVSFCVCMAVYVSYAKTESNFLLTVKLKNIEITVVAAKQFELLLYQFFEYTSIPFCLCSQQWLFRILLFLETKSFINSFTYPSYFITGIQTYTYNTRNHPTPQQSVVYLGWLLFRQQLPTDVSSIAHLHYKQMTCQACFHQPVNERGWLVVTWNCQLYLMMRAHFLYNWKLIQNDKIVRKKSQKIKNTSYALDN